MIIHWGGTDTGQVNAQYLANYTPMSCCRWSRSRRCLFRSPSTPTMQRNAGPIENVRVGGFDLITAVGARLKELKLEQGRIGIVGPLPSWWTITLPHEHHGAM